MRQVTSALETGIVQGLIKSNRLMESMPNIISHANSPDIYERQLSEIKHRISQVDSSEKRDQLTKTLKKLEESYLGRFLISNKGLDGQITQYVVLYPQYKDEHPGWFPDGSKMEPFDEYFLNRFPIIQATQQRFNIFQEQLTKHIKSQSIVASLPCGLMDDLLTLDLPDDFSGKLVGIDADPLSIQRASQNALEKKRDHICDFYVKDAWNLEQSDAYDIITSNGLNIYVDTDLKVISLYKSFFDALKAGGILITSFVTPPPVISEASEWDLSQIDMSAVILQKQALMELIGVNWTHFYTSEQTRSHLEQVGFENIEFHWDQQRMFPTVTATKAV